tara:strand:- start:1982 stop:2752 length:771 start_codon:yes stop_codon:yes gene_type:complete
MDVVNEAASAIKTAADKKDNLNFFKYVFNFDDDNKNEIFNLIQYTVLAIIPVLLTLKLVKHIIPEEDESKGSLEIFAESVGQILLIIGMIWFIDRSIRFVPTFSETSYAKFTPVNFMLPFLIILSTLQTKLGAKFNILIERTVDTWNGKESKEKKSEGTVKVSQPLAGQGAQSAISTQMPNYQDNSLLLPGNRQLTSMPAPPQQGQQMAPQQSPDFNQMYSGPTNPMVDAQVPGNQMLEPMAANEAFGGFAGGSVW